VALLSPIPFFVEIRIKRAPIRAEKESAAMLLLKLDNTIPGEKFRPEPSSGAAVVTFAALIVPIT
jgi:hypothetical protein